jgi:tetratricopeptide (TPR) repeat protein
VREASAGSAWLVGGESGVGKSRLLNELRTIALVKGLAVFSGTAAAEGGPSNMLWRDVLRRVALYTDLSDTEAGVLKPLVPDIERLIERDVPPAPEIDPATARSRLFSVVIDVLRRQERPVLLLFENLHWVQDDILLTNRVLQEVDGLPVVIVGSYQDDERPGLPDELPTMTLIRLRRFETEQIAQLARAMLGDSTARQPDLITLLEKETDGNILFIVEVLRALAEDAGGLAAIGSSPLPAATLTAGIETIVQRRLQRVPRVFRPLLEFAAVAGREVDDKLLRYYAVEADEFLLLCADYHILEVRENQWRFIHERLREGAAAALSDAERQAVHAEVARAIEAVYGSTHHTIPMLAYHWNRAQDIAREVQYAARAAVQAVERHAYQEAIPWLERALELADLQGWEPIRRARLARQLAQCYQLGLSRSLKSIEYLERALGYLGQKKPDGQGELTQRLMIEAARQVLRRAGFRRQAPRSEIDRIQMIGQIAQSLAGDYMTYTHDYRRGFFYAVCGINQLEMTMDRRNLASSYAQMAFTLMYAGRPGLSRYYGRRAQQVITAIDAEDQAVANVFSLLTYYETFTGHFDHAERLGKRAQEIFVKLGSHGSGMVINFHLAIAAELEGRYEDALHYRQAHQQDTAFTQALHAQVWTGAGVGQIKALQGRLDEALDIFLERSRLIDSLDLTTSTRWTYIALVYWRLGDHDRAEGYLNQAMEEVTRIRQPDPHDVYAIFNTAEVAFGLWEADPANRERRARASVALGYVRRYGHAYPVGRPFALIYDGIDQWITGQPTKATRLWRKAAQEAADLGIPLAEAIACWQLGRQGIGDLKQRRDHLTRAAAILERIGAQWHHQQVQAAAEGIAQPVSGSAPGAD